MAVAPAEPPSTSARPIMAAFKEALGAALLALGLSVPILALRTEQDISNQLILQPRWGYVPSPCWPPSSGDCSTCLPPRFRSAAPRGRRPWIRRRLTRLVSIVGLIVLLLYPWLALALTGRAGAIKWIDNFGIQIMIYIMLGWGLNIVVGLAGLLDLGYVAFYAVGAYSTRC